MAKKKQIPENSTSITFSFDTSDEFAKKWLTMMYEKNNDKQSFLSLLDNSLLTDKVYITNIVIENRKAYKSADLQPDGGINITRSNKS